MEDPFKQQPSRELAGKDVYFNQITKSGQITKYKLESGVPVKVADLGDIKDYFNHAIMKASMMSPDDLLTADLGDMTHIEIAAIKLAAYAAAGDLKATQELFDRVLGKAKLVSQSTNINLSIDDILNGVKVKDGVTVDV
ncbi:MAG: hypothetical protein KAU50_04435 [Candidatus Marinimicrobia bacterium]|nr:hypothetical protein [Candidatus Neomarinimicrobiota bacterium]